MVSLKTRARKVVEIVMTQNQKEKLVKKLSDIENCYQLKEIIQIVSKLTGDSTVENMIEFEFNAKALDNQTLREIESFASDPNAHVDQKVMHRIEGFIDFMEEEHDSFNEKEKFPMVNSEPTSSAEKRKRTGNGNVSTESGSEQKRSRK